MGLQVLMKAQPNNQHLQIIDRIKAKYSSKPSYKVCEHFVGSKVESITETVAKEIMEKFVGFYGMKKSYDDEELIMMILMCIVAQRGGSVRDTDKEGFAKYRQKNLKLKSSKTKEGAEETKEEKPQKQQKGVNQETKLMSSERREQPAVKAMKYSLPTSMTHSLVTQASSQQPTEPSFNKTSSSGSSDYKIAHVESEKFEQHSRKSSSKEDEISIPLDNDESTNKKNSSQQNSKKIQKEQILSIKQNPQEDATVDLSDTNEIVRQISEVQTDPPRKFSFGSNKQAIQTPPQQQQFQKSISVKMQIEVDEINEKYSPSSGSVDTPTFTKKTSELSPSSTNRFFQSQLQLSTRMPPPLKSNKPPPQIRIERYIKHTQYLSTVVRYEIHTANTEHPPVFRRYSEFLKLQTYLRESNKGIIIPELPPKENIVATFWASSEATLMERKKGLEEFLNKCLGHEVIGRDPLLLRFIDDQNLDESNYNQESIITTAEKYIHSLWNITASTEQLKDYGMAYFSYMKTPTDGEIDRIQELFKSVSKQLEKVSALKDYTDKMESIQLRRGKIQAQLDLSVKKPPTAANNIFKKELQRIIIEFSQAKKTYDDFCALKNNKLWLEHLYGAKINKADQQSLLSELKEAEKRIQKVTPILEKQMKQFLNAKKKNWPELLNHLCVWKGSMRGT